VRRASTNGAPRRRRITIAGAGPGGICTAVKLKQAGIEDFVLLEKSGRPGGTWSRNRYPGLSCDVPSMLYSFTFEQKVDWSRPFATQAEILEYMAQVVETYELAPHIRLHSEIREARWDDPASAWRITTSEGWTTASDVLISGIGMFNRLRWPDIPGLDDFAGLTVHSGAWPEDGVDVRGRAVAVIGSAASAVQMIPELADEAQRLDVYQRTANWVFPKEDGAFSAEEIEERLRDPSIALRMREEAFELFERLLTYRDRELIDLLTEKGAENLAQVRDPELRERLRPRLPFGAQRPLNSDVYYPTFNREHVTLVTEPIERITARGIRLAGGTEREADVLVCATGYEANRFLSVIDVLGREGARLAEAWADGPYAFKGIAMSGFPNLFMLYGPNTNTGSILQMLEHEVDYVLARLQRMEREGLAWIDVRRDALEAYNETLQRDIAAVEAWHEVGSRYYRADSGRIVTQFPGNMTAFATTLAVPDDDAYEVAPRKKRTSSAEASGPVGSV
jgi:cation diffusion facilitator CzcD-associated flavoprotein CzcO